MDNITWTFTAAAESDFRDLEADLGTEYRKDDRSASLLLETSKTWAATTDALRLLWSSDDGVTVKTIRLTNGFFDLNVTQSSADDGELIVALPAYFVALLKAGGKVALRAVSAAGTDVAQTITVTGRVVFL